MVAGAASSIRSSVPHHPARMRRITLPLDVRVAVALHLGGTFMKVFRVILLGIIILGALVIAAGSLGSAPTASSPNNYESLVTAAMADYEANAATSENVYQQQVTAAWAAKDLLMVIGKQNAVVIDQNAMIIDNQDETQNQTRGLIALGALLILSVAVIGMTLLDRKPAAPTAPAVQVAPIVPPAPTNPEPQLTT